MEEISSGDADSGIHGDRLLAAPRGASNTLNSNTTYDSTITAVLPDQFRARPCLCLCFCLSVCLLESCMSPSGQQLPGLGLAPASGCMHTTRSTVEGLSLLGFLCHLLAQSGCPRSHRDFVPLCRPRLYVCVRTTVRDGRIPKSLVQWRTRGTRTNSTLSRPSPTA